MSKKDNINAQQQISERSMLPIWSLINQAMKGHIAKWNLHMPAVITLLHVHTHPDDAEPARLSECVGVPRQTMTFTLDMLERQRLASRKPHPKDRRRKIILLSDKGSKLAENILQDLLAFEAKALSEFSADELTMLRTLTQKLADALKNAECKM